MLNHIPSLGSFAALGLLLLGLYEKNERLQHGSIMAYLALALLAIPTYISGAASRWNLQGRGDTDALEGLIFAHQNAAVLAFACDRGPGLLRVVRALAASSRRLRIPKWNVMTITGLGVLTAILMTKAGSLGGRINHPEVRSGMEAVSAPGEPGAITFAENIITGNNWAWPAMEAAHFLGLALIFGTVIGAGTARAGCRPGPGVVCRRPPDDAHRRSGPHGEHHHRHVLLHRRFRAATSRWTVFPPKIIWLMIGGFAMIYFTSFDGPWKLRAGDDAPIQTKAMAALILGAWLCVIVFGRLLPYYGGGG